LLQAYGDHRAAAIQQLAAQFPLLVEALDEPQGRGGWRWFKFRRQPKIEKETSETRKETSERKQLEDANQKLLEENNRLRAENQRQMSTISVLLEQNAVYRRPAAGAT
jgi:hypothetical protein